MFAAAAVLTTLPSATRPTLKVLQPSLQITADCWHLLSAPDDSSRKEHDLPQGEREPESAYRKRLEAARPSGFFRDALRSDAGMLSRGSWLHRPFRCSRWSSMWMGTDLGVFLAAADPLGLRDGAALVLVPRSKNNYPVLEPPVLKPAAGCRSASRRSRGHG